jgi:redox-sensitive bicupin YhaK (pirin superfamily)
MLRLRKAKDRGQFDHGWLQTAHTFSFADYHDPHHMGFRALRVINEDVVAPGQGFGMHGHRDMEIVTLVLRGALEHRDNLGNGEALRPGELQRMSAGTGIMHSEFNPSDSEPVHLYQIWLLPEKRGLSPSYEQKPFDRAARIGSWQLVASPDGAAGSLTIHQDARLFLATIPTGQMLSRDFASGRHGWLQVVRGALDVDGQPMATSDGLAISDVSRVLLRATQDADVLLFDLP